MDAKAISDVIATANLILTIALVLITAGLSYFTYRIVETTRKANLLTFLLDWYSVYSLDSTRAAMRDLGNFRRRFGEGNWLDEYERRFKSTTNDSEIDTINSALRKLEGLYRPFATARRLGMLRDNEIEKMIPPAQLDFIHTVIYPLHRVSPRPDPGFQLLDKIARKSGAKSELNQS